jgi:hypothetical protein
MLSGDGQFAMLTPRSNLRKFNTCKHRIISALGPIEEVDRFFCSLEDRIPTQTNRSDEQIEWQQFATPPRLAWLAAGLARSSQTSSC